MKLTNEQIEQILDDAPKCFLVENKSAYIDENKEYWFRIESIYNLENLREILSLRKELEQTKKELEQVINEESDGIDGVV